jgi:multidrug efflux pump subunit AcrB
LNDSKRDFSSTFEITTRRPVAIFMVVLAIAVFGYVSYQQLPLNMMPDISYPTLTVRTDYPDTAPEEVENLISRPIEQALPPSHDRVCRMSFWNLLGEPT